MQFLRRSMLLAAVMTCPLAGQAPAIPPAAEFDVAVIKPTIDRNAAGLIVHLPGERGYRGTNMPLLSYLTVAFQVRPDQISGPDWLHTTHLDMEGKADHTCTADELHQMLQHLLVDRFHIKMHTETRPVAGYTLVIDVGGPKLADHDPEDHLMLPIQFGPGGERRGKNVSMQYFAFYLSQDIGETVVDQTGLKGHYDFSVKWGFDGPMMMPPSAGAGSPPPPGPPSMELQAAPPSGTPVFEALRKQLGLRLDKGKVPSQHIVIEHIEPLSGN